MRTIEDIQTELLKRLREKRAWYAEAKAQAIELDASKRQEGLPGQFYWIQYCQGRLDACEETINHIEIIFDVTLQYNRIQMALAGQGQTIEAQDVDGRDGWYFTPDPAETYVAGASSKNNKIHKALVEGTARWDKTNKLVVVKAKCNTELVGSMADLSVLEKDFYHIEKHQFCKRCFSELFPKWRPGPAKK